MRILTCAVCGLPLSPENAYRCSECGRIVCRDHIVLLPDGRRVCTSCLRKRREERERRLAAREIVLSIPAVEF